VIPKPQTFGQKTSVKSDCRWFSVFFPAMWISANRFRCKSLYDLPPKHQILNLFRESFRFRWLSDKYVAGSMVRRQVISSIPDASRTLSRLPICLQIWGRITDRIFRQSARRRRSGSAAVVVTYGNISMRRRRRLATEGVDWFCQRWLLRVTRRLLLLLRRRESPALPRMLGVN